MWNFTIWETLQKLMQFCLKLSGHNLESCKDRSLILSKDIFIKQKEWTCFSVQEFPWKCFENGGFLHCTASGSLWDHETKNTKCRADLPLYLEQLLAHLDHWVNLQGCQKVQKYFQNQGFLPSTASASLWGHGIKNTKCRVGLPLYLEQFSAHLDRSVNLQGCQKVQNKGFLPGMASCGLWGHGTKNTKCRTGLPLFLEKFLAHLVHWVYL